MNSQTIAINSTRPWKINKKKFMIMN